MKLSIVIPVLDSHVGLQRLVRYYSSLNLSDDVEIIVVDDGSDPPLSDRINKFGMKNLYIYPTGDTRPWTIACARNLGISVAAGKNILNIDVDHFASPKAIRAASNFKGHRLHFRRQYGILDERGKLCQDTNTLARYGLKRRNHNRYTHIGINCMPKSIITELGGYPEFTCDSGHHPTREDQLFYWRFKYYADKGFYKDVQITKKDQRIYCFPEGCQKLFFHRLPKKTVSRKKINIHEAIHYHPSPEQPQSSDTADQAV